MVQSLDDIDNINGSIIYWWYIHLYFQSLVYFDQNGQNRDATESHSDATNQMIIQQFVIFKSAFPGDRIPIWSRHDYSDPNTQLIGHVCIPAPAKVLERKFPGVLVQWENGYSGWVNEWNTEIVIK